MGLTGVGPQNGPSSAESLPNIKVASRADDLSSKPEEKPFNDEQLAKLANYLDIKVTAERATLMLKANHVLEKIFPTAMAFKQCLHRHGAVHGYDEDLLHRIVAEKLFDRTHIVAQSTPPEHGMDARIETLVKVTGEAKPVVMADGHTDYRNVDNIQQVADGAVLQIKHAATEGKPGCTVQGQPLPAKAGQDTSFKPGVNTQVSPDGMQLLATHGGYLFLKGDVLGVGEDFQLPGDVNFKTGNIRYHGDVHIAGGVADGFSVEADGNIIIEGPVDGAVIRSLGGSITLKGALFGHGRAEIHAAKDIALQAAQDATLNAGGMLTAEKELRLCNIICGTIKADAQGCHLVGGTLSSYGETRLAVVGGEGIRTEVRVGDKAHEEARAMLGKVIHRLDLLRPLLTSLEPKLKQFKTMADRMHGHLPVRVAADLKATVTRYAEAQKAVRGLSEEESRLRLILATPLEKHWPVVITEKLVDSAHLKIYGLHADLVAADAPAQWMWTRDGILKTTVTPT